jgi:hypothetical protein
MSERDGGALPSPQSSGEIAASISFRAQRGGCCAMAAAAVPLFVVVKSLASWGPPGIFSGVVTACLLVGGLALASGLTAWQAADRLRSADPREALRLLDRAIWMIAVPAVVAIVPAAALLAYGVFLIRDVHQAEEQNVPQAGCGWIFVWAIFAAVAGLLTYIVPALVAAGLLRRAARALRRATHDGV